MKLKNLFHFIFSKTDRFDILNSRGLYANLTDEEFLKKAFKVKLGYALNITNPRTFNEKLQWLKLYDHNLTYSSYADKYEAKQIISRMIGEAFIIPTLGVYDSFDEICFENLPEQFVIKCTHDSGGVVICKNKKAFSVEKAKQKIERSMRRNYYLHAREWQYKAIKPRIIVETYMEDAKTGELNDYKVFVFHGDPYCIQVDYDRFTNHHRNFYSVDWEYMPFTTRYPTDPKRQISRPGQLEVMLELSKKISASLPNAPFLRVDFYLVNEHVYFGEVTFYHGSGMEVFAPKEYDLLLGEKIHLESGRSHE